MTKTDKPARPRPRPEERVHGPRPVRRIYGKTPWKLGPVFRAERCDRNRSAGDDTNERYTVGAYVDVLPVNARLILDYELDHSDAAVKTGDRAILFGQVVY